MPPRARRVFAPTGVALAALVAAAIGAPLAAPAAEPTIYKWVDEHGVAHYTTDRERIPAAIRDRVEQGASGSSKATGGSQWLLRDAGEPAPPTTPVAAPEPFATEPRAPEAPPAAPPPLGEPGDAVHAVPVESPWYEAPGAEAVATPPAPEAAPEMGALEEPPGPAPVAAPPRDPETAAALAELDRKITALEGEIARDEEALMQLISATEGERQGPIVDDPKFREIAQRLPRLQADLEALRERRGRIEPTPVRP